MLCFSVMLCYVTYLALRHGTLLYVTLGCVMLRYAALGYVTSRYVVMLRYVMLCSH